MNKCINYGGANTAAFLVKTLFTCILLLTHMSIYGATVIASSVLPVSEYTRITIESDQVIVHSMLILKNPNRIVLDIKNTPINQTLKALVSKILPDDFYIKQLRVASFKQGITRIVVDLRTQAKPRLTAYQPVGEYKYRLTLDVFPLQDTPIIQENAQETFSGAPDGNIGVNNDSKSSGAKIILEPGPLYEPEPSQDAF
ncbi:MAG: AMIN domain-containing protein [Methylotenera sp.]